MVVGYKVLKFISILNGKNNNKIFLLSKGLFRKYRKKNDTLIKDFIVRVSGDYAGKAFNSNESFLSKKINFKLLFLTSDTIAF